MLTRNIDFIDFIEATYVGNLAVVQKYLKKDRLASEVERILKENKGNKVNQHPRFPEIYSLICSLNAIASCAVQTGRIGVMETIMDFLGVDVYKNVCSLILTLSPPNKDTLSTLPVKSNTAYVRSGDQLFYINKRKNECIEFKIEKDKLKQLDEAMKPTNEARILAFDEYEVGSITGTGYPSVDDTLNNPFRIWPLMFSGAGEGAIEAILIAQTILDIFGIKEGLNSGSTIKYEHVAAQFSIRDFYQSRLSTHRSRHLFGEAVTEGKLEIVQDYICTNNVDTLTYDQRKELVDSISAALRTAAFYGHTSIVQTLLASGADANATGDDDGDTAIIHAANQCHVDTVKVLLTAPDIKVNIAKRGGGDTALLCAAKHGCADIVRALLDKGADINAANKYGETALILAAKKGHTQCVALLAAVPGIQANAVGVMPYEDDKGDGTALMYAANRGYRSIVDIILSIPGLDITVLNKVGRTAAQEAIRHKQKEIARQIVCRGKEVPEQRGITTSYNRLFTPDVSAPPFSPEEPQVKQETSVDDESKPALTRHRY